MLGHISRERIRRSELANVLRRTQSKLSDLRKEVELAYNNAEFSLKSVNHESRSQQKYDSQNGTFNNFLEQGVSNYSLPSKENSPYISRAVKNSQFAPETHRTQGSSTILKLEKQDPGSLNQRNRFNSSGSSRRSQKSASSSQDNLVPGDTKNKLQSLKEDFADFKDKVLFQLNNLQTNED